MHTPDQDLADAWPAHAQQLWQRLQAHQFDDPHSPLPFTRRLARDNHWSLPFAERVVQEYRRFCFLACVGETPVTPSDQVDQAWHLHLLYSRDYWNCFCDGVLARPLHHGPTRGGRTEAHRYDDQYTQTRHAYLIWFGHHPPVDVWPCARERFGRDTRWARVNLDDYWLLPKLPLEGRVSTLVRAASLAVVFGLCALAATNAEAASVTELPQALEAAGYDPYALGAMPFLWLFGLTCVAVIAGCAFSIRMRTRELGRGRGGAVTDPDIYTTAQVCGGRDRVLLTALTCLADGGHVTVSDAGGIRARTPPDENAHRIEWTLYEAAAADSSFTGKDVFANARPSLKACVDAMDKNVEKAGLVLSPRELPSREILMALLLPVAIALPRLLSAGDNPIGFLVVMTAVCAIVGPALVAASRLRLTEGGVRVRERAIARAAPLKADRSTISGRDLLLGAAVFGGTFLTGSVLADVRQAMPQSQGGDGGAGGCGTSSDGDGGGGCGGCGGD